MICDLTYYVENTETWIFRLIKLDKNINDRCAQVCFVNKTDECETHMLICYLCRSERHRRNSIDFGFYIFVETQRPDFRNSAFRTATQQAVKTICNIYLLLLWTYEWSIWNTEPHCIWLVTKADELCTLSACLCTSSVWVVSSILEIDWNLNFMSSHIEYHFGHDLCITNKKKSFRSSHYVTLQ